MAVSDDELRAVVFARVEQLCSRFAGRIPRSELSQHVVVAGESVPIWNFQKGIYKPKALGPDGAALSVQTSAASPYADVHDASAGRILYKYQGTDPNNHDNVALRRAMSRNKPIVYFVAVDPGVYDAIYPVYVIGDEPDRLQFVLVADQPSALAGAEEGVLADVRRRYATREVVQRMHQQQFRRVVLAAYREQCAMCQLRHVELLDAAHILPDNDPLGEPVVSNGLGLCKIHHSAFDSGIVGVDPDARIHIRGDVLIEIDGPMLRFGLQALHGSQLIVPRKEHQRPNREFLAQRFERFRAA